MIEFFLVISVLFNITFIIYSRWLIKILKTKEEEVDEIADQIAEYVKHVNAVHEMEMFYGDPTLQALIEHGTDMVKKIEQFDFLLKEEQEAEK